MENKASTKRKLIKKNDDGSKKKFQVAVKMVMNAINPKHAQEKVKSLTTVKAKSLMQVVQRNLSNFFYQNIYIVTNVSMMVWSILYHSWFGFVLLIWANVIWIRSNQRKNMMKSSPFLVSYVVCLLLITYICNVQFNDEEFPTTYTNPKININQIGLVRYKNYAGFHLVVKSLLTLFFWMTMRLMCQEKIIMTHKRTLKFEETIRKFVEKNTFEQEDPGMFSKVLTVFKKACSVCLMWVIVFTLFVIGVTGNEMSLTRIVNVSFFLLFILLFQCSLKLWLKSMKVFWSTLILFSLVALVLVYASQFDDFPLFSWQSEIGLHKHETGTLFVKLLSFTSTIILTGIQLNHFHLKFLQHFMAVKMRGVVEGESSDGDIPVTY